MIDRFRNKLVKEFNMFYCENCANQPCHTCQHFNRLDNITFCSALMLDDFLSCYGLEIVNKSEAESWRKLSNDIK